MHRRRIVLEKKARRLLVEDRLEMRGEHEIELIFHCAEHCRVESAGFGHALAHQGRRVLLNLPAIAGAGAVVHRGSFAPVAGWVSRHFDSKFPSPTIVWRATLRASATLRTEIAC
jgi:hypothetical protein